MCQIAEGSYLGWRRGGALFSKLGISLMFEYFIRCVGYKLRCRNEIITQSLTSRTGQVAVDELNL